MSDILAEMRGVLAGHAEECGPRAPQLMVNDRLYPDEIEDWAREVARLRRIEAAARVLRANWDGLCRCVDEFEPDDMAACGEWRDYVDTAILQVVEALGEG